MLFKMYFLYLGKRKDLLSFLNFLCNVLVRLLAVLEFADAVILFLPNKQLEVCVIVCDILLLFPPLQYAGGAC